MFDGNILMLVHPVSGDNIFYKVKDDKSLICWIHLAVNLKRGY